MGRSRLVLRGAGDGGEQNSTEDKEGARGGHGQGRPKKQHWLRSGSPPPRHSFPLSGPKMEDMLRELDLDLEDAEEAKLDALIRELDHELPPADDSEDDGLVRELHARTQVLRKHAPTLYNYARALHLAGDAAKAAAAYREALACCALPPSSACGAAGGAASAGASTGARAGKDSDSDEDAGAALTLGAGGASGFPRGGSDDATAAGARAKDDSEAVALKRCLNPKP